MTQDFQNVEGVKGQIQSQPGLGASRTSQEKTGGGVQSWGRRIRRLRCVFSVGRSPAASGVLCEVNEYREGLRVEGALARFFSRSESLDFGGLGVSSLRTSNSEVWGCPVWGPRIRKLVSVQYGGPRIRRSGISKSEAFKF